MTERQRRWTNRVLRWPLGLIFVVAAAGLPGTSLGTGKLAHPSGFVKSIHTYKMVPQRLVFPMAMYLPWFELIVGLALLLGLWRREALWMALALCAVFLAANLTAMARGLEVDCGCFGSGYHGSARREALIAAVMAVICLAAIQAVGPPVRSFSRSLFRSSP
jgi:uncharacterized membrane protein YphA (DoxX/SURF4 family)